MEKINMAAILRMNSEPRESLRFCRALASQAAVAKQSAGRIEPNGSILRPMSNSRRAHTMERGDYGIEDNPQRSA
jgi:hypothetical protein